MSTELSFGCDDQSFFETNPNEGVDGFHSYNRVKTAFTQVEVGESVDVVVYNNVNQLTVNFTQVNMFVQIPETGLYQVISKTGSTLELLRVSMSDSVVQADAGDEIAVGTYIYNASIPGPSGEQGPAGQNATGEAGEDGFVVSVFSDATRNPTAVPSVGVWTTILTQSITEHISPNHKGNGLMLGLYLELADAIVGRGINSPVEVRVAVGPDIGSSVNVLATFFCGGHTPTPEAVDFSTICASLLEARIRRVDADPSLGIHSQGWVIQKANPNGVNAGVVPQAPLVLPGNRVTSLDLTAAQFLFVQYRRPATTADVISRVACDVYKLNSAL